MKTIAVIIIAALAAFWLGGSFSNAQTVVDEVVDYPLIPTKLEGVYTMSFDSNLGSTITLVDPELQRLDHRLFFVGEISEDVGLLRSSEYAGQLGYVPFSVVFSIHKMDVEN